MPSAWTTAGTLLLVAPTLAFAAVKDVQPAKDYQVFGPRFSPAICELPKAWKVHGFPRPSQQGEHVLFTATHDSATLAAASYTDMHPKFPTAERYLKSQSKNCAVQRIVVGPNRRLARYYERVGLEKHDVFVVLPRINTHLYCVLRYSAKPDAFDKYYPDFRHMLDTWLFRTDPTKVTGN